METSRKFTTGDVVEMTINILSNISVPVGLNKQIAEPIEIAIMNLKKVQEAWAKEAEKAQSTQDKASEDVPAQEESNEVNPDQWEESE